MHWVAVALQLVMIAVVASFCCSVVRPSSRLPLPLRVETIRRLHSRHGAAAPKPGSQDSSKPTAPLQRPKAPVQFIEEEFLENARYCNKTRAPTALTKLVQTFAQRGKFSTNLLFQTLKILQNLDASTHVEAVYESWAKHNQQRDSELWSNPEMGVSLTKLFCRVQKLQLAEGIAGHYLANANSFSASDPSHASDLHFFLRQDLANQLALGHAINGNMSASLQYLTLLAEHKMDINAEYATKLVHLFLQEARLKEILKCIRCLVDCGGLQDHESRQLIARHFMRTISFVKGAISMETLPETTIPEIMFVGRSNVGKSSLINSIVNLKKLAYTSKTAGKTTEFNFFATSGLVGVEKEPSLFHLVDVPGVGYAEISKRQVSQWLDFQREYVHSRPSLRCVFHLVDSRHGLLDADHYCLQLLQGLPDHVTYVVVFTKLDKIGRARVEVNPDVQAKVVAEISKYTDRAVPMLFSSSHTGYGATELLITLLECIHRDGDEIERQPA